LPQKNYGKNCADARTKTKEKKRCALSLVIYKIVAYFRGIWLAPNKFSKGDTLCYAGTRGTRLVSIRDISVNINNFIPSPT